MDSDSDFIFKIVVIGDSNVGKTSIIDWYSNDIFLENRKNTIGVDFTVIERTIETMIVSI